MQSEQKDNKRRKENKQSLRELWHAVKHVNKCRMESPEEEGRENSWLKTGSQGRGVRP